MRDETIRRIIQRLNSGRHGNIIVAPLTKRISWGYVWNQKVKKSEQEYAIPETGSEFYFVKAADGVFAAAVYWMGCNQIHWYVRKKYRGKGLLPRQLKRTILPFIFHSHGNQERQELTIEPGRFVKHSERIALKVGFEFTSERDRVRKYTLMRQNVLKFAKPAKIQINEENFREIREQTLGAFRATRMTIGGMRVLGIVEIDYTQLSDIQEQIEDALRRIMNFTEHEMETIGKSPKVNA